MKKLAKSFRDIALITLISVSTVGLTACSEGNNTGGATLAGATAGGLIGRGLFGRSATGIIAGALVGGIIGNQIGKSMDRQDRANMQNAITTVPVGSQAKWTNPKSNVTYEVTPTKAYHRGNRYCREYRQRVQINGKWQQAYGRACRQPDGSWKIIK